MKYQTLTIIFFGLASLLQAQTIPTPTQTDELIIDNGAPGQADPGDRIRYKVTITNTGMAPATNVQLDVTPDALTTLLGGSFRTSPLAFPDAYACTGNVGISVSAVDGLLANDFDDNPAGLACSVVADAATAQGGSISIAADGSFSYTPPPGFTGDDTYAYTLNDGNPVAGVAANDMGTVTITVSNVVWFVDNTGGGAGGTGTLSDPFKTLGDFNTSAGPLAGHLVFISHTGTNYGGGIVLENSMTVFGSGHTGGANLADVLPFSLAPNSAALPAINGTRPVITNASGDGVALASGNTLRGFNVGACSDFGIDDNGDVGTLTISELDINNTTGGAFQTDGGTLDVTLGSVTSAGGSRGIHLDGTGGSFTVLGATSCTNTSGQGIRIAYVSTNVSFAGITVGGSSSSAESIEIIGNTGTFTASGTTTINAPVVADNISLHILFGSGTITFAGIDINGRRGKGIRIAGGDRNISTGAVDIDNPNSATGSAIEVLVPSGGTISFGATTVNNNGAMSGGIEIQNNTAAVSFATGSSITNCAGVDFSVNQGTGNITYNGSIASTAGGAVRINGRTGGTASMTGNISSTAAANAIQCNSNSGGTIVFSGASKSFSSSSAAAVSLTGNTGATFNFTGGGLVINTTTGIGFNATGGGTVSVQGTGNTITSTSATALNVVNTTIGASGLTFQSISSGNNTAAADPANGIVLNSTGANGGLTVTGTGTTDGSGGTIQNITGNGAGFISASNISLKNMDFLNCASTDGPGPCGNSFIGNSGCNAAIYLSSATNVLLDNIQTQNGQTGINGINVTHFDLLNSFIDNHGDEVDEDGIRFVNLLGTANIKGNTIEDSRHNNIFIYNTEPTALALNIGGAGAEQNEILRAGKNVAGQGNDGILLEGTNNSNITANISNNVFHTSNGDHVQVSAADDADWDITISNNSMNTTANVLGGGITLSCYGNWDGQLDYIISNNVLNDAKAAAINVNLGTSTLDGGIGTYTGSITDNTVAVDGPGILLTANGGGTLNAVLQQNQINRFDADFGIRILSRDGSPTINATLNSNSINTNSTTSPFVGLLVQAGAASGDSGTICANLTNNSLSGSGGNNGGSDTDFRLRQRFNTTINLPGYMGANNNTAAVVSFVQSQGNTGTGSATVDTNGFTGTGTVCN